MCKADLGTEVAVGGNTILTTDDDVVAIGVKHLATSQRASDSVVSGAVVHDGTNVGLDVREGRADRTIILQNKVSFRSRFK